MQFTHPEMPENLKRYASYHIQSLSYSTKMALAWQLDPDHPTLSANRRLQDWRGVAEELGFGTIDIENFQRPKSPMMEMLLHWSAKQDAYVGTLLNALCEIERFDVLQNDDLEPNLREFLVDIYSLVPWSYIGCYLYDEYRTDKQGNQGTLFILK